MASQEDTQEGHGQAQLLAEALRKEGLEVGYWLPKLSKALGVQCTQALQHLQYEDYLVLERQVRHSWEKRALQKLLKITDSRATSEQQEKQSLERTKLRQEVAKQVLDELREMLQSHSQEAVRQKAEALWQAVEIPKELWAAPKKPSEDGLESIQRQLVQQESPVGSSGNIPDAEVLRRASGGLALQGIYRTSRAEDVLAKREQLIRVPEGFQLLGSEQGSLFERKEFSSHAAESTFAKSMEQLGFSISVSAKAQLWAFKLEAGADHSSSSQAEDSAQSHSEQSYFCTTNYLYTPLASCYFQRHQLLLSDAALRALQDTERLLSFTREEDKPNLLESFFSTFGSHINQGPLHFGGIFWWKASAGGFRAEQREEMKRQTSEALNGFVEASFGCFKASAGGATDVSRSSSQVSVQGSAGESSQATIQLQVFTTGGPSEGNSLPRWKMGLTSSNSTWCVIDRGSRLIPVWDVILRNHSGDFGSAYGMSRALRAAYKALTRQSVGTSLAEELASAAEEARDFMEIVKTWEGTVDEKKLLMLKDLKQDLSDKTKDPRIWVDVCLSDKALQDFLVNTVTTCQESPPENSASVKTILRCLLDPHIYSVKDFPKTSFIMRWIFQTDHRLPKIPNVSEFEELLQTLQGTMEHIHTVTYAPGSSASAIREAQAEATQTTGLAIYSLLRSLQERAQKDVELLVLLIATSTGYQAGSSTFEHLLGHPEIGFLAQAMDAAHKEFMDLREQGADRAEASLLLRGLTVTPQSKELSPEQKGERLAFMEGHMEGSWSAAVKNLLQKHRECRDWETLERELNSLISGSLEETGDDVRMQNILKDVEDHFQTAEPSTQSKSESGASESKADEAPANQEFLQLLKRLGLESHYPRKMGTEHFHVICKMSLHDSQPSKDQELPFHFLQKLLTVDYGVRYLTCRDGSDPGLVPVPETTEQEQEPSDSFENFLHHLKEAAPRPATRDSHVHPMDLHMAIFHCADDFLRQSIVTKLAFCQLALPLLVPEPGTAQIEFPLWALSQIKRSWKEVEKSGQQPGRNSYNNKLIHQAETPIVSFIRIGTSASSSKSQLLNALLSKQRHDTFFHRHCRGSTRQCLLMAGVVEIAWYCPRGSPDDTFERCVAFCNLHGDARDHGAQLRFLQEISAVNVALVSESEHMDDRGKKLLSGLWQSQRPLVCLLTEKEKVAAGQCSKNVTIGIKNRNEAEMLAELTKTIRNLLEGPSPRFSLDACLDKARQHGFLVDEDRAECVTAKATAEQLVSLLKETKLSKIKSQLLPLQGKLWHQWCQQDKELTRLQEKGDRSIEHHRSQIESKKAEIRRQQLEQAFPLNQLMEPFLGFLQSQPAGTKNYFLQWMKVFMDDLSSGHLERLRRDYHKVWSEILEKKKSKEKHSLEKNKSEETNSLEEKKGEEKNKLGKKKSKESTSVEKKKSEEKNSLEEKKGEEKTSLVKKKSEEKTSPEKKKSEENTSLGKKKSEERTSADTELLSRLDALSDEINESSIGLEHLLREVGQIYEALDLVSSKRESVVKLPKMAADLLVSGYPMELMDGDASYLPLRWVGAIFDSLIERLGDKRVFVLSVLGLQSTGKSTLLNAMFGLQLSVSAGRCTRGAFMQLLPLDEELQKDVGFDYVLVVDTEGLRAVEMANKRSLNHDNELATFVIGIGNMTLINVFGENPSEMQDVLQIAVQAFLRMKKVNLAPSCLFVHQNVGEVTAEEQNMEGQRRFQEKLDEMTVAAAQQEFCDVSSFSDVIRFDVNTHIHYFAHLWEGNPPMAPPNPTYSHNVQQLKSKVLQAAKESQGSILRLSSLKVRIGDLWNALLNENFVFSFKNSLEIAAYRKLETAFSQWTWRLRSYVLDIQMRLDNRIRNGDLQEVTTAHLEELVQETNDAIVADMGKYFREDKDREMLVQWRGSTELKLKELKNNLILETQKKCENLIELQKTQSKLDARKSEYEDELLRRSRELALSLKGDSLSEAQLRDSFTSLWARWIAEVSRAAPRQERVDIDAQIEAVLVEHFKEPGFPARIKSFPKDRGFPLDLKKHVTKKMDWKKLLPWNAPSADVNLQDITDNIVKRVMKNIDKKEREKQDYSRTFIHEILHEVQEGVNSIPSDAPFRVNKDYSIDLSLYLCTTAAERFKAMHETFQKANDPVIYLSSKREEFFTCFQISCQGATSVTTFAVFLCDKLAPALRQAVYRRAAKEIAGEMKGKIPDFQGNRFNLNACILRFLAQEEKFQYFREYLRHPEEFFQWYIETRVEGYCLGESGRLERFLDFCLDSLYGNILSAVSSSTQTVKDREDREDKISLWLDEFCRELRDVLNLPRSDLKSLEHQEITDIKFLSEAMAEALPAMKDKLRANFSAADLSLFERKPHTILAEQFLGCWAQCPFCGAVCTNTMPKHDGHHQVLFHRPQALTGCQWHQTDHLVTDICSSLVVSDCSFQVADGTWIPFKTYREAGPPFSNWNIFPDPSVQAYWKWFVSHFRPDIEKLYGKKFQGRGIIPEAWKRITKQEALAELDKL